MFRTTTLAALGLALLLAGPALAEETRLQVSEGPPPIEKGTLGSLQDTDLQDAVRDRDDSLFAVPSGPEGIPSLPVVHFPDPSSNFVR